MKKELLIMALGAAAAAYGQQLPGAIISIPIQPTPSTLPPAITTGFDSPAEIPLWSQTFTAATGAGNLNLGGGSYTSTFIGRSPYARGKTTTTIQLQIVPVKLTINNGVSDTHVYDPTVNDGCEPVGHTAVDIVQNSPIFTSSPWTMNGVNVGTTSYHDAFTRASWWSLVGGTSYHLIENVTVLPTQTMLFGSAAGSLGDGVNIPQGGIRCGYYGLVYVNDLVTGVNNLLASLSPTVNINTLPMILVNAVISSLDDPPDTTNCCVLGFHSGYNVGPNLQVTSIFDLDYGNAFGNQDVTVISHELAEAIFDPTGGNPTPVWGNIGQDYGNCPSGGGQNNLEVGDPLSPGYPHQTNEHTVVPSDDSNEWVVLGGNGLTYHLQELVYPSWFYGGTSLGAGAGGTYYSDNGTLQGWAVLCSNSGGTN